MRKIFYIMFRIVTAICLGIMLNTDVIVLTTATS